MMKMISIAAVWAMILFFCATAVADIPQKAPADPAFSAWQSEKTPADAFGYIPSPMDWSHIKSSAAKDVLPERFDLRDVNGLTSIRFQGSCGACWAFAACAVLESWLKINESQTWDFSENHMKTTHGFEWDHCAGGNNDISTAYLARWDGPILESEDPYNAFSSTVLNPSPAPQKLLMTAPVYAADGSDASALKTALIEEGPLSVTMYWLESAYNSATHTYYYGSAHDSNHMVTLVGWDDTYSVPGAPGNGAWICKNSWSSSWGENGYFYISYYDVNSVKEGTGFYQLTDAAVYGRVYQYDPLGLLGSGGYGMTSAYGANVFTAQATESIIAVGTYALTDGASYDITVYGSGLTGGHFTNPLSTVSGVFEKAGYHVVPLSTEALVTEGQFFAVEVHYQTPGYNYPIPLEYPVSDYAAATAANGQSYISDTGTSYTDVHASGGTWTNTNVCIKAIAERQDEEEGEGEPPATGVSILGRPRVEVGDPVILSLSLPPLTGEVTVEWYKNDVLLPGVVAYAYYIPSVDYSHAGTYRAVVTDESKAVYESAPFVLQVLEAGSMPSSHWITLIALLGLCAIAGVRAMGYCSRH